MAHSHSPTHSPTAHSPLLQREIDLYRKGCACTMRVHQRAALLHEQLDRVIVFDLRFRWWGLGNNLVRWLGLLRLGLATGRATFLWFDGGQPGKEVFFDMGAHFVGQGADWSWNAQNEQRVRERMATHGIAEPTRIYHKCRKNGLVCEQHEIREETPHPPSTKATTSAQVVVGTEGEERNGSLLRLLTTHSSRWLVVTPVRPGQMTAFQPSAMEPASAVLSGQAGASWGGGWADGAARAEASWDGPCWSLARNTSLARDGTSRSTTLHLSARAAVAMGSTEPRGASGSATGRVVRSRLSAKCEAFAWLRPRPALHALLAPMVARLDAMRTATGSITGLHVRTGYPDWVALSMLPNRTARPAWVLASRAPALPHSEHWRALESYLEACPRTSSEGESGNARRAPTKRRPCYKWQYPRADEAPSVHDAKRLCGRGARLPPCLRSQGCLRPIITPEVLHALDAPTSGARVIHDDESPPLHLPGNRTLAAAVLCAARLRGGSDATSSPHSSPRGHAGLLVLGDAPGVVSLVRQLPELQVVDTSSGGRLAHTQFDAACSTSTQRSGDEGGRCTRGMNADPRGGWARTAVDFYIGGLVDAFVSALDTTFLDGAVLLRSQSCCGATSRMHFSAGSTAASNRDRPMEDEGFLSLLMHQAQAP